MIRTIFAVAAVLSVGAGTVQARECVTGWITRVDLLNDAVTLDSGDVLSISPDINLEDLSEGVRVKFIVAPTGNGTRAISVRPAPDLSHTKGAAGRV